MRGPSRAGQLRTRRKDHGFQLLEEPPGNVNDGLVLRQRTFSQTVPGGSSPTGVKPTPAKAAAGLGEEEEIAPDEHSYWPVVRKYIENGGPTGRPRRIIKPVCPICFDELTIHGVDPPKDELIDRAIYSVDCEMPPLTRWALLGAGIWDSREHGDGFGSRGGPRGGGDPEDGDDALLPGDDRWEGQYDDDDGRVWGGKRRVQKQPCIQDALDSGGAAMTEKETRYTRPSFMNDRQQRLSRRRKERTLRDSRLRPRGRATPLPTAIEATPGAEAAATPEPQPAEAAKERTRWQTLRCIIKRRQLYAGNYFARRQDFRVGCAECDGELPVALGMLGAPGEAELLERQTALMLACGHIFCYDCLERARDRDHKDGQPLSCPVCEAEMQCRHCDTLPKWVPIPRSFDGPESVDQVPLTAPEGGASPSKCATCVADEEFMANGEEEVVVQVLRDDGLEKLCNPIDGAVRRVLYMVMDDMEKSEEYVEPSADDVLSRLRELAANNTAAVWELRRHYLARREAVDKAPCEAGAGTAGGGHGVMPVLGVMPVGLGGGFDMSFTDQLMGGMPWENMPMMEGMSGYGFGVPY
ncbi:hypothetical protein CCMA1212_010194 [Trichoderma ghanense]|uniref:RING-type domain-containing protein n=1 Tax=Trichoderma ghanense TaxID=65468 RepID=A0ABY2GQK7_9HYPO